MIEYKRTITAYAEDGRLRMYAMPEAHVEAPGSLDSRRVTLRDMAEDGFFPLRETALRDEHGNDIIYTLWRRSLPSETEQSK